MESVFFLHEVVVDEVVPENRPKSVALSGIELMEEIRVEFLRPFEKIFEIVAPVVFVETHVPRYFAFEYESDFRKIPNEGFCHVFFCGPESYEDTVGAVVVFQYDVLEVVVGVGELSRKKTAVQEAEHQFFLAHDVAFFVSERLEWTLYRRQFPCLFRRRREFPDRNARNVSNSFGTSFGKCVGKPGFENVLWKIAVVLLREGFFDSEYFRERKDVHSGKVGVDFRRIAEPLAREQAAEPRNARKILESEVVFVIHGVLPFHPFRAVFDILLREFFSLVRYGYVVDFEVSFEFVAGRDVADGLVVLGRKEFLEFFPFFGDFRRKRIYFEIYAVGSVFDLERHDVLFIAHGVVFKNESGHFDARADRIRFEIPEDFDRDVREIRVENRNEVLERFGKQEFETVFRSEFRKEIRVEMVGVRMADEDRIDLGKSRPIDIDRGVAFHEIADAVAGEPRIGEETVGSAARVQGFDYRFGVSEGMDDHGIVTYC